MAIGTQVAQPQTADVTTAMAAASSVSHMGALLVDAMGAGRFGGCG